MKKLQIDRSRWLRGNSEISKLHNSKLDGMCCLGFVCRDLLTLPEEDFKDVPYPADLEGISHTILTEVTSDERFVDNTSFSIAAIRINDDKYYSDQEREEKLIELFRENGIDLSFYGEGHPNEEAKN